MEAAEGGGGFGGKAREEGCVCSRQGGGGNCY